MEERPRPGPTSCVSAPEDVVDHVVGAVDVYTRVTLLGGKSAKGSGTEADSVALCGLWGEFDIDGAPDGRGGTTDGGFESIEAAAEFAPLREDLLAWRDASAAPATTPWWSRAPPTAARSPPGRHPAALT